MATTLAKRQHYRLRGKSSICRKKSHSACKKHKSCKNTRRSLKRKQFCRRKTNMRIQMGGKCGNNCNGRKTGADCNSCP